jgi:arylsulfatase A-like enzyme
VLTIYLSGTDLYAHVADEGPDEARRSYLKEVVDPALAKLLARLRDRHAMDDRYVVVTADHGHTEVVRDDAHALAAKGPDDPPTVMKKAGYRVRPFALAVSEEDDFDSVLVEGGAVAYVYVADRSVCPAPKTPCDWARPPRFEEDVIPMAEAFYRNNKDGSSAPKMKGTLDLVLTRHPKPVAEDALPFEVYVGSGKTVPLGAYLSEHPHPTYVDVVARFRDLAVGPRGERAGDILLLAHNGDRKDPADRFYFASPYRSWHGSPSRQDSEIPLIVANPRRTGESIHADVARVLGGRPYQQKVTDLLLDLRARKN